MSNFRSESQIFIENEKVNLIEIKILSKKNRTKIIYIYLSNNVQF